MSINLTIFVAFFGVASTMERQQHCEAHYNEANLFYVCITIECLSQPSLRGVFLGNLSATVSAFS